jgi:hypothetical protein
MPLGPSLLPTPWATSADASVTMVKTRRARGEQVRAAQRTAQSEHCPARQLNVSHAQAPHVRTRQHSFACIPSSHAHARAQSALRYSHGTSTWPVRARSGVSPRDARNRPLQPCFATCVRCSLSTCDPRAALVNGGGS